MQISKPLVLFCALALATLPVAGQTAASDANRTPARTLDDSDAQARARAALRDQADQTPPPPAREALPPVPMNKPAKTEKARQPKPEKVKQPKPEKIKEVKAKEPKVEKPKEVKVKETKPKETKVKEAKVKETKPAPAPKVAQTIVPATRADPDAIAKARESMRQQIETIPASEPAPAAKPEKPKKEKAVAKEKPAKATKEAKKVEPTKPARPVPPPQPPAQPAAPVATKAKPAPEFSSAPDSTSAERAQPAKTKPVKEARKPAEPKPAKEAKKTKPAPEPKPAKEAKKSKTSDKQVKQAPLQQAPEFKAMQGPESGLATTKQQKLSDLLKKYQADELSPEQYHQQRSKILAEP